jgi:sugar lactone lactonase YvrE
LVNRASSVWSSAVFGIAALWIASAVSLAAQADTDWPVAVKSACDIVGANVRGTEDIALIDETRLLVSATDRRMEVPRGGLCVLDIASNNAGNCRPVSYADRSTPPAAPHGIFLVPAQGASKTQLLVIDHFDGRSRLLQFELTGTDLHETRAPLMLEGATANDVTADSVGQYFVSALRGDGDLRWTWFATLLGLKRHSVLLVNPRSTTPNSEERESVCRRLRFPNGVAMDSRHRLYVGDTLSGQLYLWDELDNSGTEQRCWAVASIPGADNINLSDSRRFDGMLVAGHPDLWRFREHRKSAAACSPSTVHAVALGGSPVKTVLELTGRERFPDASDASRSRAFCAGSSAVLTDDYLYVGQVFGDGVLRCPVRYGSREND